MLDESCVGFESPAPWGFRAMSASLAKTAPLDDGEHVIVEGSLVVRGTVQFRRAAYLRLTDRRLCWLAFYQVRRSIVTQLPPQAVRRIVRDGRWLTIVWDGIDGAPHRTIWAPWTGSSFLARPMRDLGNLHDELQQWRAAAPAASENAAPDGC